MKKRTRICALLLAALLTLAIAPALAENVYPLQGDITLQVWCTLSSRASSYITNLGENPAVQAAEKATGIKLEIIHPASGQEKENLNLLVGGNKVPDIIVGDYYAGGAAAAVEDGVYLDLTDYVQQYMPCYYSYMQKNSDFYKLGTTEDRRVYGIYNYKDEFEPFYYRVQFRQDILDELNMKIPETIAEYEAFFEAVKEKYPEMTPFTLYKDGFDGPLMGAFNLGVIKASGCATWYQVDGKVKHPYFEAEALKGYLTLMHKWYEAGYISKDFMSTTTSDLYTKGQVAAASFNGYGFYATIQELKIPTNSGRYMRTDDQQHIHTLVKYWAQNGSVTYVSGKASKEKQIAAMRFLDWGYSPEGILTYNFGPKGVTWDEQDENGFPIYNDFMLHNEQYPISNAEYILRLHGNGWAHFRYGDKTGMAANQLDYSAWQYRERWGDDEFVDSEYALPPFALNSDDAQEVKRIMNNVNTYANEMVLKYITGSADLANFESEYMTTIKSMHIEDAIAIYQAAYDKYLQD